MEEQRKRQGKTNPISINKSPESQRKAYNGEITIE